MIDDKGYPNLWFSLTKYEERIREIINNKVYQDNIMDLFDSKQDIRNSKLLWLITGIFLIPTLNAFESLIAGLPKLLGVTIIPRLILSVSLDGLIVLILINLLIWIIKNWDIENKEATKLITLKQQVANNY